MMAFRQHRSNILSARSSGFTLIELMISITLGLLLIAGVGYAYLGTRTTNRIQENLAHIQEGARFAFETMSVDIRMAGFINACDITARANTLTGGTTDGTGWTASSGSLWYTNLFAAPIRGFDTGATLPSGIVATGGDSLGVIHADNSREYIVSSHTATAITTTLAHNVVPGDILVASDCTAALQASLFQASASTAGSTINHAAGGTGPGNCVANLFGNGLCVGTAGTLTPGARLMKVSSHFFYIRNNAAGQPTLFRRTLTPVAGAVTTTDEELVEGVEDMQITYGVDTSATADGAVDDYLSVAEIISPTVPGANDSQRWARVLSVKINLLMRSPDNGITNAPQTYTFNGATTTPTATDRRLRKIFTNVIAVRNRI